MTVPNPNPTPTPNPTPNPAPSGTPTPTADWRASLPAEVKDRILERPADDAPDEAWTQFEAGLPDRVKTRLAVPDNPDAYQVEVPKEYGWTDDQVAGFRALLHEAQVPAAYAPKLAAAFARSAKAHADAAVQAELEAAKSVAAEADAEARRVLGDGAEVKLEGARRLLFAASGNAEVTAKILTELKLLGKTYYPIVAKALAEAAEKALPGTIPRGDSGGGSEQDIAKRWYGTGAAATT